MRSRILRALLILGLLLGVGGGVAVTSASADSTPSVSATAAATTTSAPAARGWCVRSGTGELRNLWFDPTTGKCPSPYWGPVALGGGAPGPQGPAGPAGPQGPAGDSVAKVVAKSVTLNASSPATQTVVLAGLPAKSSSVVELTVTNAGEAPAGTTVTVTPVTPAAGSTERSFTVAVSGFTGSVSFALTIKVLAVSA
jgi:hypothetical protein